MPRQSKGSPKKLDTPHKTAAPSSSSQSSASAQRPTQAAAVSADGRTGVFQALLHRRVPDLGWGFLTYKNQWPLKIGSVSSDPAFAVGPREVQEFTDSPASQRMLFASSSSSFHSTGSSASGGTVSAHGAATLAISGHGVASLKKGDRIVGLNGVRLATREQADREFQTADSFLIVLVERDAPQPTSAVPSLTKPAITTTTGSESQANADAKAAAWFNVLPRPPVSAASTAPTSAVVSSHAAAVGGLSDLPRPGTSTATTTTSTTTTSSMKPASALLSLPRPEDVTATAPPHPTARATTQTTGLGLPAPPTRSAAVVTVRTRSRSKDADNHDQKDPVDANSHTIDTADNTRPERTPSPPSVRDSLELLAHPVPASSEPGMSSLPSWYDPMQPLYCPPAAAVANVNGAENGDDENAGPCDVLGVQPRRLNTSQRVARADALRQALGRYSAAVSHARKQQQARTDGDDENEDGDPTTLLMAARHLPVTTRSAVYDRGDCPFDEEDGFNEEFHKAVQATVTRLALHREDRIPALPRLPRGVKDGQEDGEEEPVVSEDVSAGDLLLNGRYDMVLYAQTLSQDPARAAQLTNAAITEEGRTAPAGNALADEVQSRIEATHHAFEAVMDQYVTARRAATATQQEQTSSLAQNARAWGDAFTSFMQNKVLGKRHSPSSRADSEDSNDEGDSARRHAESITSGGSSSDTPHRRSGAQKRKRKRSRERRDAQNAMHNMMGRSASSSGSGSSATKRQQRQAFAAMAQLITQLQGSAQAGAMGGGLRYQPGGHPQHVPPSVGAQYLQHRTEPQERDARARRVEGATSPGAGGVLGASPSSLPTGQSGSPVLPNPRVYKAPQFPSHPQTSSSSPTPGDKEKPKGRFGLPAPPRR